MKAFSSDEELWRYFRALAEKQRKAQARLQKSMADSNAAPMAMNESEAKAKTDESVTNVQHAGVDEGGIVKVHGNHLVVLRRGRLFTVAIGDGALKPISAVDAFAPDIDPRSTWYDEMLMSGNTVVVIGYSYQRGGTEVGLFDITDDGQLSYRSTYHLRSNDYYSSRNYASRLQNSAAILFLRNDSLQFREVGELGSQPDKAIDDQCRASCIDWYGNARPLFLRGRVFALLGYEIVEGTLNDGRMQELRRINYAPGRQYALR